MVHLLHLKICFSGLVTQEFQPWHKVAAIDFDRQKLLGEIITDCAILTAHHDR